MALPDENAGIPQVSVVIPARNEANYIGACVTSIHALHGEGRAEVLVVDNGSTDETIALAKQAGAEVLEVATGTVAHLRNAGAAVARAPVLAFVDADCTVDEGWLHHALNALNLKNTVAVGCYPRLPDGENTWVQRTWIKLARKPSGGPVAASWLPSANMIVRADTFREVGGFDDHMVTAEDADLTYRLSQHGVVLYDDRVSAVHYREPATLRQFFAKEIWHGLGSFSGLAKGRFTRAEIPSLLAPVMTVVGILMLSIAILGWWVPGLAGGIVLWWSVPCAYTALAFWRHGSDVSLPKTLIVSAVYHLARAAALLKWLTGAGRG